MKVKMLLMGFALFVLTAYAAGNIVSEDSEQAELEVENFKSIPSFTEPQLWVRAYGYDTMDWRVKKHPRIMADVNGDGKSDIVGFGNMGVYVSVSDGTQFSEPTLWINKYAYNRGSWRTQQHPRMMADVNGDGKADIVGFGNSGVYVSLSDGTQFSPWKLWVYDYGYSNKKRWRVKRHPRMMADVNGDDKADIVGFGNSGVYVSLSDGTRFGEPKLWVNELGYSAGRWRVSSHPRAIADVNGDGRDDVLGFGDAGVHISLSDGTQFSKSKLWINKYGQTAGRWRVTRHPRMTVDVNGDGKADIVGFGNKGVYVSLSDGTQFGESELWINKFGKKAGQWRIKRHPRMMADVNGDDKLDIVGFYNDGVYVSLSDGTQFSKPQLVVKGYGYTAGNWRVQRHLRIMADVNGDDKQDIVGFYNDGVYVSLSTE